MLYYLAAPYSHPTDDMMIRRFEAACVAAARLMEKGIVVFSPLSHSVPVAAYGELYATDHEFWMAQDLPILELCDVLAVLKIPGWDTSRGVEAEIETAREKCMPITYLEPEEFLSGDVLATLRLDEA